MSKSTLLLEQAREHYDRLSAYVFLLPPLYLIASFVSRPSPNSTSPQGWRLLVDEFLPLSSRTAHLSFSCISGQAHPWTVVLSYIPHTLTVCHLQAAPDPFCHVNPRYLRANRGHCARSGAHHRRYSNERDI